MLETGLKKTLTKTVVPEGTAKAVASGTLDVLATPVLLAAMEETAMLLAGEHLDAESCTVGISANMKHLAATPVGMEYTVTAELTEIDRRRLVFTIEAHDEKELIATAVHERFIVKSEAFQEKANAKKNTN